MTPCLLRTFRTLTTSTGPLLFRASLPLWYVILLITHCFAVALSNVNNVLIFLYTVVLLTDCLLVCIAVLSSEPMKKKKKVDMSIIVSKEQKKRKKLEKMIKKQEQKGLKLKPIEEIEGDRSLLKTLELVYPFLYNFVV